MRSATETDVADIADLEADAFAPHPWSAALIADAVLGRTPTVAVLVAQVEEAFAGYAVVSVVDVDAELQKIAVPAAMRMQGIATGLLAAVHEHAHSVGAERLLLEVREDNAAARIFYTRHGFVELGRRARYYRDGATALVLTAPVRMAS